LLTLEVLRSINLGNSVAEFDQALERYFVETDTFRRIIEDRVDIIAGDKGTGKTALFRILHRRYPSIEELRSVEVIPAFNLAGSPVFQRLNEGDVLDEGQYITLWKSYILSLGANWLLTVYDGAWTDKMAQLDVLLVKTSLRSADDSPSTVFSSIVNLFRRLRNPRSAEAAITITPNGMPIITPRVEFGGADADDSLDYVPHEQAFALLDEALAEVDLSLWLVLDRLDEAFAGKPLAEVPALRALLRTYLDLQPYSHVRLKLFVRKDLFRRIVAKGFVNLTHVNARKVEITWDEDSLAHLLFRRLAENVALLQAAGLNADDQGKVFDAVFPPQVDPGKRKPRTFTWMMGRVRDGNDVKPPRNLIDLVQKSQEAAMRKEEREKGEYLWAPLLPSEALKLGLRALSKQRVEDTLLAEAGDQALVVERFRGSKAEHNDESLGAQLSLAGEELKETVQFLRDIGFLEQVGNNYKVPMLYRDGLGITQGKAFDPQAPAGEDED